MKQQTNNLWSAPVWAALLASGLSVLPGLLSRTAGSAGWISVAILPPALVIVAKLVRGWRGCGLAEQVSRPGLWGGLLTFIYIMYAVPLLAVRLCMGAQRLGATAQEGAGVWFFLLLLAVAAAWLGWGDGSVLLRAGAVFCRILLCVLGVVCLLSVFRLRGAFLWPVYMQDAPGVLRGAAYALGVFGSGVYVAFFAPDWSGTNRMWLYVGVGAQALAVLCVTGCLGPELAGRLADPWLTLARGVGVNGTVRRLESLVSVLWLLGDLAYLGLVLQGARRLCARWLKQRERWSVPALIGLAAVLALTALREEGVARRVQEQLVPALGLLAGVVLPLLIWVVYLVAESRGKGTSCPTKKTFKKDEKRC